MSEKVSSVMGMIFGAALAHNLGTAGVAGTGVPFRGVAALIGCVVLLVAVGFAYRRKS